MRCRRPLLWTTGAGLAAGYADGKVRVWDLASGKVREIAPAVLGVPVEVPAPGEYVADGAARQAAWVLAGGDAPPEWEDAKVRRYEADPNIAVRLRYAEVRELTTTRPT